MISHLIEVDTQRLRLRQWLEADFKPFAALNSDSRVMEFFPAPLDCDKSDEMARRFQSLITERGWGFWATEVRKTGDFIGFVGLHMPQPELPCWPCIEVGWRLAFDYWGKGYATEAAQAALRIGFERLRLTEIVSFTAVLNRRSRAVMERLHMREDVDTFEHPAIPVDNKLRQHCLYRLSYEQWHEN